MEQYSASVLDRATTDRHWRCRCHGIDRAGPCLRQRAIQLRQYPAGRGTAKSAGIDQPEPAHRYRPGQRAGDGRQSLHVDERQLADLGHVARHRA